MDLTVSVHFKNIFSHLLLLYLIFLYYMQRGSKSTYENASVFHISYIICSAVKKMNRIQNEFLFTKYMCVYCVYLLFIYIHSPTTLLGTPVQLLGNTNC